MNVWHRVAFSFITGLVVCSACLLLTRDRDKAGKPTAFAMAIGYALAPTLVWVFLWLLKLSVIVVLALVARWVAKGIAAGEPPVEASPSVEPEDETESVEKRIDRIRTNSKIPAELKEKEIAWLRDGNA